MLKRALWLLLVLIGPAWGQITPGVTPYTAGVGLSLTSYSFSANYGTTSGTAAQGNDSRIVGALQASTAAATYSPLASPALTGTPTAPTASHGTSTTQLATTAFVASATIPVASVANSYVTTSGSDGNSCLSWADACATVSHALSVISGYSGGRVNVGAGTYTISSTIQMLPGVELLCTPGAVITQGASANLLPMIDFSANAAHGAAIRQCTIDGNRYNQTSYNVDMINVLTANNVSIERNTLRSIPGLGVNVTTGTNTKINNNIFTDMFYTGVQVNTGTVQYPSYASVNDNIFSVIGAHAILLDAADYTTISRNTITGTLVSGLTVTVVKSGSNATVTVTGGGTPFSATCSATVVCPGMFIVANGGGAGFQEIEITSVSSSTVAQSVGCAGACSAAVGAAAIGGSGDLIDESSSGHWIISDNIISSAAGGLIVPNSGYDGINEALQDGLVANNVLYNAGGACISVESTGSYGINGYVQNLSFIGNILTNCMRSSAVYASYGAFEVAIAPTAYVSGLFVDSHRTVDNGTPVTPYWMGLYGLGSGTVAVGAHFENGMLHAGVSGTGAFAATVGP